MREVTEHQKKKPRERGAFQNTFDTADTMNSTRHHLNASTFLTHDRTALERVAEVFNAYPLDGADARELALQEYALTLRGQFGSADWTDTLCGWLGWRCLGFGSINLGIDDDVIDRAVAYEWARPGDDMRLVRLELGDSPTLLASENGGLDWRELPGCRELIDQLGDWCAGNVADVCEVAA